MNKRLYKDNMNEILSQDEILEGYYKFGNIKELFDSDILILPKYKNDEGYFYNQPLSFDIKREFPKIKAKCYCRSQNSIPCYKTNTLTQALELGSIVISTLAGLATICQFIQVYNNKTININLYIKFEDSLFLNILYEGKASEIDRKINEILSEKNIKIYRHLFAQPNHSDPDLIRKYKQLFDDGIITQEEYEAKKKEILGL